MVKDFEYKKNKNDKKIIMNIDKFYYKILNF